jgi:hypothetical protein
MNPEGPFTPALVARRRPPNLRHRRGARLSDCSCGCSAEDLQEFRGDESIKFCADIGKDLKMLEYYGLLTVLGAHDLQRVIPNPTNNYPHFLYALSNH